MLGNFACFFCHLLIFSKLTFFNNKNPEYQCQTVWTQIKPDILAWSGSKLVAKVFSRQQKLPIGGKKLIKILRKKNGIWQGTKIPLIRLYLWANLERMCNSYQSTGPAGRVLWEELLEEVILHITPLCSLLHTLLSSKQYTLWIFVRVLRDKCMCLQEEWKL